VEQKWESEEVIETTPEICIIKDKDAAISEHNNVSEN